MNGPNVSRYRIAAGLLAIIGTFGACKEPDNLTVHVDPNEKPPTIVAQGPDFPTGPMEVLGGSAPGPWVLVGDPNGLGDISAVFLDIQTIRLHGIILRPTDPSSYCAQPLFTPNGNVDTSSLVPVPIDIGQVKSLPLSHDQGGIYRGFPFVVPRLYEALPVFGPPSGCGTGSGWLAWLTLLPPAAPSPTTVFVTYVDEEFIGITVTVFDSAGASAKTTFPNLRVVFTTSEEKAVAP